MTHKYPLMPCCSPTTERPWIPSLPPPQPLPLTPQVTRETHNMSSYCSCSLAMASQSLSPTTALPAPPYFSHLDSQTPRSPLSAHPPHFSWDTAQLEETYCATLLTKTFKNPECSEQSLLTECHGNENK